MAFPFGPILAGAGSILGGILGDKGQSRANAANEARFQEAWRILQGASVRQRILYNSADEILKARSRMVLRDITRAEDETRTGTRAAEQAVMDQSTAAEGQITQGLVGRGMATGSLAGNLQRALASDTGRAVGAIRENQGQRLAMLALQRAQVRSGLMGDQAQFYMGRSGAEVGLAGRQVDLLSSKQDVYQPSGLAGNLGILGGVLGGLFGGGGGGGGSDAFSGLFSHGAGGSPIGNPMSMLW